MDETYSAIFPPDQGFVQVLSTVPDGIISKYAAESIPAKDWKTVENILLRDSELNGLLQACVEFFNKQNDPSQLYPAALMYTRMRKNNKVPTLEQRAANAIKQQLEGGDDSHFYMACDITAENRMLADALIADSLALHFSENYPSLFMGCMVYGALRVQAKLDLEKGIKYC